MIKPDYTKQNFIPQGVKVETVPTTELKPDDRVLKLGEVFIVVKNDKVTDRYFIKMKHETDTDTFINEQYITPPNYVKTDRRIIA